MSTRIKGQNAEISIYENNVPLTTIRDIRSIEIAAQLEILREGYLGETTDRRDSVYRGLRGRMEMHFENRDVLDFMRRLVDKARSRTAGIRVNVEATFAFDTDRVRLLLSDLSFGEIPIGFGSRTDFGTITLEFEGQDYNVVA